MIYRLRGNEVAFSLEVGVLDMNNEQMSVYDFTDCTDLKLMIQDGTRVYLFEPTVEDGVLKFALSGTENCGVYDVELMFVDANDKRRRTKVRDQIALVDAVDDLEISKAEIEAAEANLGVLMVETGEGGVTEGITMAELTRVLNGYLTKVLAADTYQPKGNYLTQHQSLTDYLTKALAADTYQPKGNYLTQHQSLTDYLTKALAAETYQPKGNYLTQHQSLTDYLTKALAAETYQPKGEYLTDVSDKADKWSVQRPQTTTVQIEPGTLYIWENVTSIDITLAEHNEADEFLIQFNGDAALILPDDVKVMALPTFSPSAQYMVSIMNGLAIVGEWKDE